MERGWKGPGVRARLPDAGAPGRAPSPGPGRVELGGEKGRGRPQDFIHALELGVLFAKGGKLLALGGAEDVASLAGIDLGLTGPVTQGLVVHAEFLGHGERSPDWPDAEDCTDVTSERPSTSWPSSASPRPSSATANSPTEATSKASADAVRRGVRRRLDSRPLQQGDQRRAERRGEVSCARTTTSRVTSAGTFCLARDRHGAPTYCQRARQPPGPPVRRIRAASWSRRS